MDPHEGGRGPLVGSMAPPRRVHSNRKSNGPSSLPLKGFAWTGLAHNRHHTGKKGVGVDGGRPELGHCLSVGRRRPRDALFEVDPLALADAQVATHPPLAEIFETVQLFQDAFRQCGRPSFEHGDVAPLRRQSRAVDNGECVEH